MNSMAKFMIGDGIFQDQNLIEDHILNHFSNRFVEPVIDRPFLQGLSFAQITASQNQLLTRPFEEAEIYAALASMPDDKAPDVDGFPIGLIKKSWPS